MKHVWLNIQSYTAAGLGQHISGTAQPRSRLDVLLLGWCWLATRSDSEIRMMGHCWLRSPSRRVDVDHSLLRKHYAPELFGVTDLEYWWLFGALTKGNASCADLTTKVCRGDACNGSCYCSYFTRILPHLCRMDKSIGTERRASRILYQWTCPCKNS
eukprot:349632-Chlamydomonas_euryale.AAC.45